MAAAAVLIDAGYLAKAGGNALSIALAVSDVVLISGDLNIVRQN
jgi:hypothetical protein